MPGYYGDVSGEDYGSVEDMLGYGSDVEILGMDPELLGMSDVEILGRVRAARARRSGSSLARNVAASRMAAVVPKGPSGSKDLCLPCTAAAATAAGATTPINLQPTQPFRANAWLIDPVNAPSFVVNSVSVGRQNQFIGAGTIPATAFSALNPLAKISFDTGQANEPIAVSVTNFTLAAALFSSAFFGTALV